MNDSEECIRLSAVPGDNSRFLTPTRKQQQRSAPHEPHPSGEGIMMEAYDRPPPSIGDKRARRMRLNPPVLLRDDDGRIPAASTSASSGTSCSFLGLPFVMEVSRSDDDDGVALDRQGRCGCGSDNAPPGGGRFHPSKRTTFRGDADSGRRPRTRRIEMRPQQRWGLSRSYGFFLVLLVSIAGVVSAWVPPTTTIRPLLSSCFDRARQRKRRRGSEATLCGIASPQRIVVGGRNGSGGRPADVQLGSARRRSSESSSAPMLPEETTLASKRATRRPAPPSSTPQNYNNGTVIIKTATSAPLRRRKVQSATSSSSNSNKWDRMVSLLQKFRDRHGHAFVTDETLRLQRGRTHQKQLSADDQELLAWTKSVRHNYRHQVVEMKRGIALEGSEEVVVEDDGLDASREGSNGGGVRPRLSIEKLQVLFELDFVWDAQLYAWEQKYRQLVDFKSKYGHCRVPNNSLEYPRLGVWVRNQRRERKKLLLMQQQHQEGELALASDRDPDSKDPVAPVKSTLTPDRLRRLEALEFDWYKCHDDTWNDKYRQLQEYVNVFGHANVKQDDPNHFALGQWCMNQRIAYRKQQQMQLHQSERKYNNDPRCASSQEFTTATNSEDENDLDCRSSTVEGEEDGEVGGALTPTRIQRLERLGFSWHVRDDNWQSMKQRLVEYYRQNGHIHIPTPSSAECAEESAPSLSNTAPTTSEEVRDEWEALRTWLNRQRHEYKRRQDGLPSALTMERIHDLETSIPNFSWQIRGLAGSGPSTEDWSKLFDAMRAKGLKPGMRPKSHWFEGAHPFQLSGDAAIAASKEVWTEQDLLALWNQEEEEESEEDP